MLKILYKAPDSLHNRELSCLTSQQCWGWELHCRLIIACREFDRRLNVDILQQTILKLMLSLLLLFPLASFLENDTIFEYFPQKKKNTTWSPVYKKPSAVTSMQDFEAWRNIYLLLVAPTQSHQQSSLGGCVPQGPGFHVHPSLCSPRVSWVPSVGHYRK
jgi:hypothetical protein